MTELVLVSKCEICDNPAQYLISIHQLFQAPWTTPPVAWTTELCNPIMAHSETWKVGKMIVHRQQRAREVLMRGVLC